MTYDSALCRVFAGVRARVAVLRTPPPPEPTATPAGP